MRKEEKEVLVRFSFLESIGFGFAFCLGVMLCSFISIVVLARLGISILQVLR